MTTLTETARDPKTGKGRRRRQDVIEGAAAILLEQGPKGVTHRAVAQRVGCSLSATTYYFSGLDDLLEEAGRVNIARWASRAERVAEAVELEPPPATTEEAIQVVLRATLPSDETLLGHYLQLVAAAESPPVRRAYRTGRDRLNTAVHRVLQRLGSSWSPEMVIAVVDGACVSALSEGRDPYTLATELLRQMMTCQEAAIANPPRVLP